MQPRVSSALTEPIHASPIHLPKNSSHELLTEVVERTRAFHLDAMSPVWRPDIGHLITSAFEKCTRGTLRLEFHENRFPEKLVR